jgi:hypothetical protein
MIEYNAPVDVDWQEVDMAIEAADGFNKTMLKLMGEHGRHVFGAGLWLSSKLSELGWSDDMCEKAAFDAGRMMTTVKDPWDISKKVFEEAKLQENPSEFWHDWEVWKDMC